ncbi:EamA family transporter [Niallia nealsonii]|uniref:EamA family transporter n=1 Tax=Niallia nealsonii TaxID=115979 RepID=A0A2N0Z3X4_9BACI|nr:DMT family transporter [Niallia nealsonii]PKG24217.1 EamA family transporter [Niallia nealsonii]
MKKLKYSFFVLAGAISYGLLSTAIKLGMESGFTVNELVGGQYLFGWLGLFLVVLVSSKFRLSKKLIFSLLLAGIPMSLTGITYGFAVKELSASVAIVFLFQFTWIGVIIEAIANKKFPGKDKWLSISILFIGTLFAGGIFNGSSLYYSGSGIIFGLLAACFFALNIFFNSRIATRVPAYTKSFYMTTGATIIICSVFPPTFLSSGALLEGLWKYGFFLGLFGVVLPVICFSIGAPKVGAGLGTILSSVELPVVAIASITFLHETVSGLQWIGIFLILVGIIVPNVYFIKKKRQQQATHVA